MSQTRGNIYQWRRSGIGRIGMLAGTLFAALCVSCAMASFAAAEEQVGLYVAGEESEEPSEQPRFEAEEYPADIYGPGTSTYEYTFPNPDTPGWIKCPESWYTGEATGATGKLTLFPTYVFFSCTSSVGGITIEANGCAHTVTLANSGPPYVGEFGVSCEGEEPYRFVTTWCTVSIPAQSGLAELSFSNAGEGNERTIELGMEVSGLKYTMEGLACSGTYEDGTLTGTSTLKGYVE